VSIQWYAKPYCLKGAVQCSLIYIAPDVPSGNCNYVVVGYVVDGYACEVPAGSYVLDGYVLIGYVEE